MYEKSLADVYLQVKRRRYLIPQKLSMLLELGPNTETGWLLRDLTMKLNHRNFFLSSFFQCFSVDNTRPPHCTPETTRPTRIKLGPEAWAGAVNSRRLYVDLDCIAEPRFTEVS